MRPQDIKILGVTVTYNNEDKIPYVMPYYERIGIDKLVVYDNGSTDRTVEMLSKYPFVEIRSYTTERYDEGLILKFKTEIQNEFKGQYHWCISTYFDEVFYSDRDFREVLYEKMCEGKTYFLKTGLNIFSRTFPPTDNGKLIHENVGRGSLWTSDDGIIGVYGNKVELFNMNKVYVRYHMGGCHECQIFGEDSPFEDDIAFFHLKFIDFDFIVKSNELYRQRTEGTDIICYDYFAKNMEKVYQLMEKRAISIEEYMNTPMHYLMPQQVVFLINEADKEMQKRYIDAIKEASDSGPVQQYGILFYGVSDENYDEIWYYGRHLGLLIMNHSHTDNGRDAVRGFGGMFGTTLKPEPWIAQIGDVRILTPSFFRHFEKLLIESHKKGVRDVSTNGIRFIKYNRFIEGNQPSTLGCYMIVRDEEQTIKNCLDSIINICDEIVIVDTGCIDKTMDIARAYGDKIKTYEFKWINDFAAARNFAMSKVSTDYSFTTDADEIFSPRLRETIIKLKERNFNGLDSVDIYLLNHNGTDVPNYYVGGRQIVKNYPSNIWKYKIHEKLYFRRNTFTTIDLFSGYILHKHNTTKSSTSNYNKYAEWYYKDLNMGDNYVLSKENGAHYFYYLFYTLRWMDELRSRQYLKELYNKDRIISYTEDQRANMYPSFISFEELFVFELLNNSTDASYMAAMSEHINENFPKYLLLHRACEIDKNVLSQTNWINLSFISYNYGLIDEFITTTEESHKRFPNNSTIKYNMEFINNTVRPIYNSNLLILASDGLYVESTKNYYSHMFKKAENNFYGNYDYQIDLGDTGQLTREQAFHEYTELMFGRESKIKKIGG